MRTYLLGVSLLGVSLLGVSLLGVGRDWGYALQVVTTIFRFALAILFAVVIWKIGTGMLGSLARPIPAPPPDGELRRVNMRYRCPSCGTEIRMVKTDVVDPVPPRHCMDEMDLIAIDGEAVDE